MHHIHFHIHALIHYIRHARMIGSYLRWLGVMLFTLLLGLLLQLVGIEQASAAFSAKDSREFTTGSFSLVSAAGVPGKTALSAHRVSPLALQQNTHTGVFHRLKPRLVMIPRMNRTPKPKSVYRCFTRAPGELSF